MRIAVASQNPTKLEAVRLATRQILGDKVELSNHRVETGVSNQPMGLEETYTGAENRARAVREIETQADLGVGLEGGLLAVGDKLVDFGIVVVLGRDSVMGVGMSRGLAIPDYIVERIRSGMELSEAVADYYDTDTLNDRDCSAVVTHGYLPAAAVYREATTLALLDYLGYPAAEAPATAD